MMKGPQEGVEEGESLKDLSLVWFAGASYISKKRRKKYCFFTFNEKTETFSTFFDHLSFSDKDFFDLAQAPPPFFVEKW